MTTKIQTFGGNIGIGTTDPGEFKLNVNGSLKTTSLEVNGVTDAQVPIGLLGMWSGSLGSIPSGWALCDGNEYTRTDGGGSIFTPNLQNRFIRGADEDAPSQVVVGSTGGSNNVELSVANLAPHKHDVTVNDGNATHGHGPAPAPITSPSIMQHGHPVGSTTTQHSHGETSYTNTPHSHAGSGGKSPSPHRHSANQANMPHSHDSETVNAPHSHYVPTINQRSAAAGAQLTATRVVYGTTETFGANAGGPHSHNGYQTTPQHAHGCPAANAPHGHNTGSDNWPHNHLLKTVNAPHGHQTGDGQAPHTHTVSSADASHEHSASSSNTGGGTPFSVINEYYALFYIMKI
jgi:hypothetical protein